MDELSKRHKTLVDELDETEQHVMLQHEAKFQKALQQAAYL